jgi:predicted  nucleic acid-binding Zn-ribbon protein
MNKNTALFLLFAAALLGSTWGAVVNRQKIDLEQQLKDARTELQKCIEQPGPEAERMPGTTAALQKSLAEKEEQLAKARNELAELRKGKQALEAKLSGSSTGMQGKAGLPVEVADQRNTAGAALTPGGEEEAGQESGAPGELQKGGSPVADGRRLEEVNAQLLGLEKIVEEKNMALQQNAAEKERLLINMDVLLGRIADQQRELQAIQEEKRELVKQLAARKELVDFQEKLTPAKE